MKRNGFEIVPIDIYDPNAPENRSRGRVLAPYDILTIRSLEHPKVGVKGTWDFYFKIVPCHPILATLGLPRILSKNREEMEPDYEVVYADEAARNFCEKYKNAIFKDGFPHGNFVIEAQFSNKKVHTGG